ncbi:unnamed protein product [Closterium sp. NIES-54]
MPIRCHIPFQRRATVILRLIVVLARRQPYLSPLAPFGPASSPTSGNAQYSFAIGNLGISGQMGSVDCAVKRGLVGSPPVVEVKGITTRVGLPGPTSVGQADDSAAERGAVGDGSTVEKDGPAEMTGVTNGRDALVAAVTRKGGENEQEVKAAEGTKEAEGRKEADDSKEAEKEENEMEEEEEEDDEEAEREEEEEEEEEQKDEAKETIRSPELEEIAGHIDGEVLRARLISDFVRQGPVAVAGATRCLAGGTSVGVSGSSNLVKAKTGARKARGKGTSKDGGERELKRKQREEERERKRQKEEEAKEVRRKKKEELEAKKKQEDEEKEEKRRKREEERKKKEEEKEQKRQQEEGERLRKQKAREEKEAKRKEEERERELKRKKQEEAEEKQRAAKQKAANFMSRFLGKKKDETKSSPAAVAPADSAAPAGPVHAGAAAGGGTGEAPGAGAGASGSGAGEKPPPAAKASPFLPPPASAARLGAPLFASTEAIDAQLARPCALTQAELLRWDGVDLRAGGGLACWGKGVGARWEKGNVIFRFLIHFNCLFHVRTISASPPSAHYPAFCSPPALPPTSHRPPSSSFLPRLPDPSSSLCQKWNAQHVLPPADPPSKPSAQGTCRRRRYRHRPWGARKLPRIAPPDVGSSSSAVGRAHKHTGAGAAAAAAAAAKAGGAAGAAGGGVSVTSAGSCADPAGAAGLGKQGQAAKEEDEVMRLVGGEEGGAEDGGEPGGTVAEGGDGGVVELGNGTGKTEEGKGVGKGEREREGEGEGGGDGRGGEGKQWDVQRRERRRKKLLQFVENTRPAYYGTYSLASSGVVRPRAPLRKDPVLNYDVDSEAEWEEEDPAGESLSDSEGEDDLDKIDPEEGGEGEDEEEEDGFVVPDGYLSEDEGVDACARAAPAGAGGGAAAAAAPDSPAATAASRAGGATGAGGQEKGEKGERVERGERGGEDGRPADWQVQVLQKAVQRALAVGRPVLLHALPGAAAAVPPPAAVAPPSAAAQTAPTPGAAAGATAGDGGGGVAAAAPAACGGDAGQQERGDKLVGQEKAKQEDGKLEKQTQQQLQQQQQHLRYLQALAVQVLEPTLLISLPLLPTAPSPFQPRKRQHVVLPKWGGKRKREAGPGAICSSSTAPVVDTGALEPTEGSGTGENEGSAGNAASAGNGGNGGRTDKTGETGDAGDTGGTGTAGSIGGEGGNTEQDLNKGKAEVDGGFVGGKTQEAIEGGKVEGGMDIDEIDKTQHVKEMLEAVVFKESCSRLDGANVASAETKSSREGVTVDSAATEDDQQGLQRRKRRVVGWGNKSQILLPVPPRRPSAPHPTWLSSQRQAAAAAAAALAGARIAGAAVTTAVGPVQFTPLGAGLCMSPHSGLCAGNGFKRPVAAAAGGGACASAFAGAAVHVPTTPGAAAVPEALGKGDSTTTPLKPPTSGELCCPFQPLHPLSSPPLTSPLPPSPSPFTSQPPHTDPFPLLLPLPSMFRLSFPSYSYCSSSPAANSLLITLFERFRAKTHRTNPGFFRRF